MRRKKCPLDECSYSMGSYLLPLTVPKNSTPEGLLD